MPEVLWYYAIKDQQFGPVSVGELKHLADAGELSRDDLLWREGMDAWTTATHLRGLFEDEMMPPGSKSSLESPERVEKDLPRGAVAPSAVPPAKRKRATQSDVLRIVQLILWSACVLVALVGVVLFTRAFMAAGDAAAEAAAAAVFSSFFIASYVLARAGEKLAKLLEDRTS